MEKNGQDQVLGRAAAGFDQNDFSFGTLPPHFDDSDGPALSLEEWECILPGYSTFYSVVFRVAIPFLLASIVFHQDLIKDNFRENPGAADRRVGFRGFFYPRNPRKDGGAGPTLLKSPGRVMD